MKHERLSQAYQLIKAGRRAEARAMLEAVLDEAPDLVDAHWLMSLAAGTQAQARHALETLLIYDPEHAQARRALARLAPLDDPPEHLFGVEPEKQPSRSPLWWMVGAVAVVLLGAVALLLVAVLPEAPCMPGPWLSDYTEVMQRFDTTVGRQVNRALFSDILSQNIDQALASLASLESDLAALPGEPACVRPARSLSLDMVAALTEALQLRQAGDMESSFSALNRAVEKLEALNAELDRLYAQTGA